MLRRVRAAAGGIVYHVLNRGVGRIRLFRKAADLAAMERVLEEAFERTGIRILAYCVMSNHWHLLLCPRAFGELSEVMRWLTLTHTQRWHANRHTSGSGPIYQGRFESFPVQSEEHFLAVAGLEDGALIAERPHATPDPIIEVRESLPDGTEFKAVWSHLRESGAAKLVTVHFFDRT